MFYFVFVGGACWNLSNAIDGGCFSSFTLGPFNHQTHHRDAGHQGWALSAGVGGRMSSSTGPVVL